LSQIKNYPKLDTEKIAFGTYRFGENTHNAKAEIDVIKFAFDQGIRIFDTAPLYSEGNAESLLGKAIHKNRDDVFLISKINPWDNNLKKTLLFCEQSLRRLQTDYIDLYLIHWRGPVPLAESFYAMEKLKESGKIGAWGVSNFDIPDISESLQDKNSLGISANQILFNPIRRYPENQLITTCSQNNIKILAYSPFERDRYFPFEKLESLCHQYQCTAHALVLAWIMQKNTIPIFQSKSLAHIERNLKCKDLYITPEDVFIIDSIFPTSNVPSLERDDHLISISN